MRLHQAGDGSSRETTVVRAGADVYLRRRVCGEQGFFLTMRRCSFILSLQQSITRGICIVALLRLNAAGSGSRLVIDWR